MKILSDLTYNLVKSYVSKNSDVEAKLIINWSKIAKEYKYSTFPKKIQFYKEDKNNGTLLLYVRKAFGLEIQMVSPKLIVRINDFLGYKVIDKIKIIQTDFIK